MVYVEPTSGAVTSGTTPNGTPYKRRDISWSGRAAYVYVPDHVAAWTHTSLLYLVHGVTGTRTWAEDAIPLPHLRMAIDRGWIVVSGSHQNLWGNPVVMADFRNLYEYVARRWWIDQTIFFGHSMGGMTVLVAGGRREVPDIAGVMSLNGMIDVYDYHDSGTLAAYGAATWEELPGKIAGHDPVNDDPERWRDLPIMLVDTPADTSKRQSDVFIARSVTPAQITQMTGTQGHMTNPYVAETNAWLQDRAPAYVVGQSVTSQPVPKWPGWEHGGGDPPSTGGSGLYTTGGSAAILYTTGGSTVQLYPV